MYSQYGGSCVSKDIRYVISCGGICYHAYAIAATRSSTSYCTGNAVPTTCTSCSYSGGKCGRSWSLLTSDRNNLVSRVNPCPYTWYNPDYSVLGGGITESFLSSMSSDGRVYVSPCGCAAMIPPPFVPYCPKFKEYCVTDVTSISIGSGRGHSTRISRNAVLHGMYYLYTETPNWCFSSNNSTCL